MRLTSIFLFLTLPALAGYGTSVSVTIDHTKVSTSNQANFPVLICANGAASTICDATAHTNLAIPNLKTVGNGGLVTSTSGFDIGFFSDAGCTSTLNYELAPGTYVATTGYGEWHVLITTLSTSVDNVFYLCFGNAAVTTNQSTTATWNSSFKAVYHFGNGTTLNHTDSTSNARTLTPVTAPAAVAGQISGAINTIGGYDTGADTGLPSGTASRTLSVWTNTPIVFSSYKWFYGTQTNEQAQGLLPQSAGGGVLYVGWNDDLSATSLGMVTGTWYYETVTFVSETQTAKYYLNGVQKATGVKSSWNTTLTGTSLGVGKSIGGFSDGCQCHIDEFRIANDARIVDWILTEYNNQSSPSTFYTFGAAVAVGAVRHKAVSQ